MEIALIGSLIGSAGVIAGIIFSVISSQRCRKQDDTRSGMDKGLLDADMKHIKDGIDKIQQKLDRYDSRFTALEIQIGRVDECAKSAHKRMDEHVLVHEREE